MKNKFIREYVFILIGSIIYALSTVLFVFNGRILLGGTTAISVMLSGFLPFLPGEIHVVLNTVLLIAALVILGKSMALKTLIGSIQTTIFTGLFERLFALDEPLVENILISAILGAGFIAIASGILFYVDSSSGGTDIVALVIKKFSEIRIGRALLVTDVLIVIIGGLTSSLDLFLCSVVGLLIKTLGTDLVIKIIKTKLLSK